MFETCRLHDVDKDDTIGPKKVNGKEIVCVCVCVCVCV